MRQVENTDPDVFQCNDPLVFPMATPEARPLHAVDSVLRQSLQKIQIVVRCSSLLPFSSPILSTSSTKPDWKKK